MIVFGIDILIVVCVVEDDGGAVVNGVPVVWALFSDSPGVRMINFNTRQRIIAEITEIIKEIQMVIGNQSTDAYVKKFLLKIKINSRSKLFENDGSRISMMIQTITSIKIILS